MKVPTKGKVLVCDDDPVTCELIGAILADAGYAVKEVYDGLKALKELTRRRYDVMILDYRLGQIDGLDILQKAGRLDHKVRIIMISGYQSDDLPKRAKELGASDFLPKPLRIRELLNAVEKKRRT